MKLQETIPLSSIYTREEDFSTDLADNLDALGVGSFEDPKIESPVGKRRADIVAVGEGRTSSLKISLEKQIGIIGAGLRLTHA